MKLDKTLIFFTASEIPTAPELALIARHQLMYGKVLVRSGSGRHDATYNSRLEHADALAGTIPAAYKTASGGTAVDTTDYPDGDKSLGATSKPEGIMILPATASFAHTGTLQLRLVKAELDETTDVVTLTDITSGAESAWSSGTPGVATIDADSGLVTGVTAGTTLITATVTYDTDKTMTTTRTVTAT
jgi:hypothetical protein